jgi:hypothetical protein
MSSSNEEEEDYYEEEDCSDYEDWELLEDQKTVYL